ncbi:MAG: serine protease [Lachnospiraceae bacterium]|nr:serine protease [Lachnospiraceae bacterium]
MLNLKLISKITAITAVIFIFTILVTACSSKSSPDDDSYRSCCVIKTSTQASSGFIINIGDEYVTMVCTAHGTDDWGEGSSVVFFEGSESFGQIYGVDDELDLAFIDIPVSELPEKTLSLIYAVKRAPEEVDITSNRIYAYNFFYEDKKEKDSLFIRTDGELETDEGYVYDLDVLAMKGKLSSLSEGMSGSPLFNKKGECIGMIRAGDDEGGFAALSIKYFPEPYK